MTPAFEHHDKIAAVQPGKWLRCVGPVKAVPTEGGEITLRPGTMLRVHMVCGGIAAHFDAGERLRKVSIPEEWWHNLEIATPPQGSEG